MKISALLSVFSPPAAGVEDWHSTEPWVVYGMRVVGALCLSLFIMSFLPVSGAVVTTGTVTVEDANGNSIKLAEWDELPRWFRELGPSYRAANAAGGITTNVATMLKYAAFHMGDGTSATGERVLSAATLQRMRSAAAPKAGSDLSMGLTWHLGKAGNLEFAEHGGGTNGQISHLRLIPSRRFALAIVTNSGAGGNLNAVVLRAVMEAYFDVPNVLPERITVASGDLAEFAGTYRRQFADIVITADGDALKLETRPKMPGLDGRVPPAGPPQRLGFYAKDKLLRLEGPGKGTPAGEFVRGADGKVAWLRMSRILRRVN